MGYVDKLVVPASEIESTPGSSSHPAAPEETAEQSNKREVDENSKSIGCKKSFEPTCDLYSYLRFWNHKFVATDCQQSPLRPSNIENVPLADRKYLLFEPDRGYQMKKLATSYLISSACNL